MLEADAGGHQAWDVLKFRDWLLDDEEGLDNSQVSVKTHLTSLKTFFNQFEIRWPLKKTDKVSIVEKEVRAYSQEEISGMLSVANQDEADLLHFLLCTGARRQEVIFSTWADVSFSEKTFHIREKRRPIITSVLLK